MNDDKLLFTSEKSNTFINVIVADTYTRALACAQEKESPNPTPWRDFVAGQRRDTDGIIEPGFDSLSEVTETKIRVHEVLKSWPQNSDNGQITLLMDCRDEPTEQVVQIVDKFFIQPSRLILFLSRQVWWLNMGDELFYNIRDRTRPTGEITSENMVNIRKWIAFPDGRKDSA